MKKERGPIFYRIALPREYAAPGVRRKKINADVSSLSVARFRQFQTLDAIFAS